MGNNPIVRRMISPQQAQIVGDATEVDSRCRSVVRHHLPQLLEEVLDEAFPRAVHSVERFLGQCPPEFRVPFPEVVCQYYDR